MYGIPVSGRLENALGKIIPMEWTEMLSPIDREINAVGLYVKDPRGQLTDITRLHAKDIYKTCISKKPWVPTARVKWQSILPLYEEVGRVETWTKWYRLPYVISREVRLQSFQYRIINRTLPCRYYLKQLRVVDSDICQFCADIDDLFHFLYNCDHTRTFWDSLAVWLKEYSIVVSIPDVISEPEFFFGLLGNTDSDERINFIL